jgi:hypothetical protein
MYEQLKVLYNHAMGTLIEKYASNGIFFTQKEFEEHRGKIFMVTLVYSKLQDLIKTTYS